MSTYLALWPVVNDQARLADLKDEAFPQLLQMLARQGVTITGPVRWSLTDHTESETGLGLAATVEVN